MHCSGPVSYTHLDVYKRQVWEKVTPTKSWTLACNPGEACIVYAQFKDAAQNVSLIVNDAVELDATAGTAQIFLPLINR